MAGVELVKQYRYSESEGKWDFIKPEFECETRWVHRESDEYMVMSLCECILQFCMRKLMLQSCEGCL